jgi:hypothetical protein
MQRPGIGRFVGLPKEIVVVMLAVALMVTFGVDLMASPGAAPVTASYGHFATDNLAEGLRQHPVPATTQPPSPPASTSSVPEAAATTTPPGRAPSPIPTRRAATPVAARPAPAPAAPPGARVAKSIPLGVYVGAADPSGVAHFAAATGTHPAYAADYLPANAGWDGMTGASSLSWLFGAWRGTGYTLILGVPMIPTDANGNAQGTLAGGAAGQYNSWFATLASTLVSYGEANAVLRLGWEFNGNWYPWSVTDATDAANYAAYFRNIVASMRAVPGEAFRFVWNPNAGSSFGDAYGPTQTYPGSGYVDYIGTDVYDQCWSSPQTPQNAWAEQLSGSWGLDWLAGFAAAEGRPIVFPEWGVTISTSGHGMGDDPSFIDEFASWVVQHNVAWTSYFDYDAPDGSHDMLDGSFPATLAAFHAVFG